MRVPVLPLALLGPLLACHRPAPEATTPEGSAPSTAPSPPVPTLALQLGGAAVRFRPDGLAELPHGVALGVAGAGRAHRGADGRWTQGVSRGSQWWVALPMGRIQHGLLLDPLSPGEHRIAVGIEGARVRVAPGGRSARLLGPSSRQLRYDDLRAWDQDGETVPASLVTTPTGLDIVLDTRSARGSITVDPVLSVVAWSALGGLPGAAYGTAAAAGDFNGDGRGDLAVGAPGWIQSFGGEGAVHVYLGTTSGLPTVPTLSRHGGATSAGSGGSLAVLDIDGDDRSDLVVGAPTFSGSHPAEGRVQVYLSTAAGPATAPQLTLSGGGGGLSLGAGLAAAGDVNGDGYGDVLIGLPGASAGGAGAGRVQLFMGTSSGLSSSAAWTMDGESGEGLGTVVTGLFDVNADGFADIALGSPAWDGAGEDCGRLRVFHGSSAGPGSIPARTWTGSGAGARLGASVAQLGDLDGDAYADVLVGEPGWSNGSEAPGRILWYQGGPTGAEATPAWTAVGEGDGALFGTSIAGLGDLNGDGHADFTVGSPGWSSWAGEQLGHVEAFLGRPGGPAGAVFSIAGDTWSPIGGALASAGDSDGNGHAELLVLRPLHTDTQPGEGLVERYDGFAGHTGYGYVHISGGGQDGARYGSSVLLAGDVNGDGYDDLVGGAPHWDNGQNDEGGVFLRYGSATSISALPDWTGQMNQAGAHFGAALAGGLDVNGDGYDDFAVGAPDWDQFGTDSGRVWVFLGAATGPSTVPAWDGGAFADNEHAGAALAMGDWNGDGHGDLAYGVPDSDEPWGLPDAGAVVVVFGGPSGVSDEPYSFLHNEPPEALGRWGAALASAGDVHGDGFEDLLVGAPGSPASAPGGGVFLNRGSPYGPVWTPEWSQLSAVAGELLGASVAGLGDVDADGFGDVLVGAPGVATNGPSSGWVGLWHGSANGLSVTVDQQWWGAGAGSELGFAVAGIGDVDGDGLPEAAFSAPGEEHLGNAQDGTIYIFGPEAGGLSAAPVYDHWGSSPQARAGESLSGGGDADGDGYADFAAGAPTYSGSFVEDGNVRLFGGNRLDDIGPAYALRPDAFDPATGRRIGTQGQAPLGGVEVRGQLRAPIGRAKVRLDVEFENEGVEWGGAGALSSPWADSAFTGTTGAVLSGPWSGQEGHRVRVAVAWSPTTGAPHLRSSWKDLGRSGHGLLADLRTAPLDSDGDGERDDTDCDPLDPDVHRLGTDLPDDGIDQDCDGIGVRSCYYDLDGDGIGGEFLGYGESFTCAEAFSDELVPLVDVAGDCDDQDPEVGAGEAETCDGVDNDCDGALLPGEDLDQDQDQSPFCADCDDSNALASPLAPLEICDGLDNDCDGEPGPGEADGDQDEVRLCDGDCDDGDPTVFPGAAEPADAPADRNCDGVVGSDVDGDGVAAADGDCDDGDATVHPGAPEVCDGLDNDCDGLWAPGERDDPDGDGALACVDCGEGVVTVFPGAPESCDGLDSDCDGSVEPGELDLDGDGVPACAGDCRDQDPAVHSGRPEDCTNGVDDDCSGEVDDDIDADGDGARTCGEDCDDRRAEVHPGATELCNGRDDDCDGVVDDGFDADGDGMRSCAGDCDDGDPTVFLDAPAICDDAIDNDCRPNTWESWDSDGDGFVACPPSAGQADCWEGNGAVFPGAPELCDHVDSDCDGEVDEGFDMDGDGWTTCRGDCDDGTADVEPGALEICGDGVDEDCDGVEVLCPEAGLSILVPRGCGCGGSGAKPAWGAVPVLGWILRRRGGANRRGRAERPWTTLVPSTCDIGVRPPP